MPAAIRAFFERYRDAFNSLDGDAIAQLYALPSGIVDGAGYTHWTDVAPIGANMRALCELYRQHGYVRAEFSERSFIAQGDDFAIADLAWRIERNDAAPWEFCTTYNLKRDQGEWKVLLCTAYSEQRLQSNKVVQ
jgi:ketosteroid isomerase-like protein